MAIDTLRALSAVASEVLVVSDQPGLDARFRRVGLDVAILADGSRTGMNTALDLGAKALSKRGFGTVLACVGDLPALRTASVQRILEAAQASPAERSFVSDASGVGTTMLIARGVALEPHFQGRSAAAHHQSGAVNLAGASLPSVPDAQRDVDTEVDLQAAFWLGLGSATSALVDHETGRLGQHQVITTTQWRSPDGAPLAITSAGYRIALPDALLADGLRQLRSGQRLHAAIGDDGELLSAWLT